MNGEFLGVFLPPVIDVINKRVPDSRLRFLISLVICLGLGVMMNLDNLNLTSAGEILKSGSLIFGSAQVSYKMFYETSGVREKVKTML